MLFDAKYKGHIEKGQLRISEADIYEALAFSKATGCNRVVLAYPVPPYEDPDPVGSCIIFEKVVSGSVNIVGVQIESRKISSAGALNTYSINMSSGISAAFV